MSESKQGDQAGERKEGEVVEISINGKKVEIHSGTDPVSAIKSAGGVPQADELEQLVNGKLEPLPDAGSVVIRGKEVFVSHTRTAQSS
jgi:predicted Rdx family selenoprotein